MAYSVVIVACILAAIYNKQNRTIYVLVVIVMLGMVIGPHIQILERVPHCYAGPVQFGPELCRLSEYP